MDLARLQPNAFTSVMTDAPARDLWRVVSNPLLLAEFSTELQEVRMLTEGSVRLGSVFEGDQLRGERRWTTTSTVTAFEVDRVFEWTVGDPDAPVSQWMFLVDEHDAGTTLTQRVTLLGGPSPMSDLIDENPERAEAIVQERLVTLRERMAVTLEGLIGLAGASVMVPGE